MDRFDYFIVGCMGIVLVFTVLAISHAIKHQPGKCFRGHYETVHHESYTSFILVGKIMVPQIHPSHDSEEWICDQHDR